jgi:hypothetical protein
MASPPGFPAHLLAEPWRVKLAHFQRYTVAHPKLVDAKERLVSALQNSEPNSLVFVFGPTGVGKTTLRLKAEQILTTELEEELQQNRGLLPVVSVEAVAPESGTFSWRDHFKRLLEKMDEPLLDFKQNPHANARSSRTGWGSKPTLDDYRYALEQALQARRPAAVMIDEAQHLAKMTSGRRLLDQLDVIKSIANRTQTAHVLYGTYDLLAFRNLNGQLSRRSIDIHFTRYRAEDSAERKNFIGVLRSFAQQLPLSEPPDLAKDWEFLFERSIGCVGLVKQWLYRALSVSLRKGQNTISRTDLESQALGVSQIEKILAEASEGEVRFSGNAEATAQIRRRLGLTCLHESSNAFLLSVPRQRHSSLRPGQRRPVRDVVGNQEARAAHV